MYVGMYVGMWYTIPLYGYQCTALCVNKPFKEILDHFLLLSCTLAIVVESRDIKLIY